MAVVVVYDANVLYPNALRDLLIRLAQGPRPFVQAKWTNEILDEVFRNLKVNRPDLEESRLDRTRVLMNHAIRDVLVTGYEPIVEILRLPDADDRHVLAAAIKAHAQVIVTNNVKDFPQDALAPWGIEAKDADTFVLEQIGIDRSRVYSRIQQIADSRRNPPTTMSDVLVELEKNGLFESSACLRS